MLTTYAHIRLGAQMRVVHAPARGGTRPLIYGYVCADEPDEVAISLLCHDMTTFCRINNYRLGSIFIDRGVPDGTIARTGFTGMLDVLRRPEVHGVLVPTMGHLSTHEIVRAALLGLIRRTNSMVLVVYEVDEATSEASTGARS